ncbi:MAG: hypothetical protein BWZ10_02394 [candidate division BRC1 bacterium ADurb.BinA364]|nr:MAG: hypothetical protein BWZ10_02394 [candidate division BRC1 bacterium ADurb.BinA364]
MTLLCDRLIWSGASGMETSAFAFAMLIAVRLHIADREHGRPGALSGLCFGIAANLRPEGLLLYAVAWADHCMAYKAQSRQFHFTLRPYRRAGAWASVALFVALVAPYMIFCWRVNGHLFANTYYVKRTEAYTVPPAVYLSILLETLRIMNLRWLFLFLVPGMLAQMVAAYRAEWGEAWPRLSRARILWLWPVLYVSISCFTNPTNLPQMSRYIAPLFPLAALLSVFGLAAAAAVWDVARKRLDRSWIPNGREMAWAAAIASALSAAAQLPHWARLTAQCVDDINRQHVGAIPYFSERRIIDTFGLVTTDVMRIVAGTPEIVLQDAPEILAYLIEKRPDYAIGYPSWFGAAARHTECFEPIFETQLEQKSPICGGELMIVWKIDWDKYDPKVEERRYSYGYGYGYGNP